MNNTGVFNNLKEQKDLRKTISRQNKDKLRCYEVLNKNFFSFKYPMDECFKNATYNQEKYKKRLETLEKKILNL